jgi:hypothetical protein
MSNERIQFAVDLAQVVSGIAAAAALLFTGLEIRRASHERVLQELQDELDILFDRDQEVLALLKQAERKRTILLRPRFTRSEVIRIIGRLLAKRRRHEDGGGTSLNTCYDVARSTLDKLEVFGGVPMSKKFYPNQKS